MSNITYEQAKQDHKFLWSIDSAWDMTGGYVDSQDLEALLESPTKNTAKRCYIDQIHYWFQVGTEDGQSAKELAEEFPEIKSIAKRYKIYL